MVPIGDSTTADMPVLETSNFQSPATLGPDSSHVFGQSWVHDTPGATELGFPAIEAPVSFPESSEHVLPPSLDSNNLGMPGNCRSWGQDGNACQFPGKFDDQRKTFQRGQ